MYIQITRIKKGRQETLFEHLLRNEHILYECNLFERIIFACLITGIVLELILQPAMANIWSGSNLEIISTKTFVCTYKYKSQATPLALILTINQSFRGYSLTANAHANKYPLLRSSDFPNHA
jgi:hypothetical protein